MVQKGEFPLAVILENKIVVIAALAGVLLVLILLAALLIRSGRKTRLWAIALVLALLAVVCALPQTRKIYHALKAYEAIKTFLDQPESVMELDVQATLGNQQLVFSAKMERSQVEQIPVTAITKNGQTLYYAQGVLFLADGTAYQLGEGNTDYSAMVELLLPLYATADIQVSKGVYTLRVPQAQAEQLLDYLVPQAKSLLRTGDLTVELVTRKGKLSALRFAGSGNLADSENTYFSLLATLQVVDAVPGAIPQLVRQALTTGNYQTHQALSQDLLRLVEAYQNLVQTQAIGANVSIGADFGLIDLKQSAICYRWKAEETDIYGVQTGGMTVYTANGSLCDAQGHTLSLGTADTGSGMVIPVIVGLVYEIMTQGTFDCQQTDTGYCYTVTLAEAGMRALVNALLPQTAQMDWNYDQGTAILTLAEGEIQTLEITCGGSTTVAVVRMGVSLSMKLERLTSEIPALPEAVREALAG